MMSVAIDCVGGQCSMGIEPCSHGNFIMRLQVCSAHVETARLVGAWDSAQAAASVYFGETACRCWPTRTHFKRVVNGGQS